MNMTPAQRAASYPPSMYDVPIDQQIVRYGDGEAMSVPAKTQYELAHETAQRNAALPVEQGGLGLPADNTAMDRAKAMGFETESNLYHGTKSDINELARSTGGEYGAGVYSAENPDTAWQFASYAKGSEGENIIPLLSRANNPLITMDRNIPRSLGSKGLRAKGFDSVVGIGATGNTQNVALDPSMLRSRFAAFDPMQRNSTDLLAGGAAATVGLGAMMPQDSEAAPLSIADQYNALITNAKAKLGVK
jgi:hypothetical protein